MQYKIENDELIPAPVNFTTPDGRTICNFNTSPELMNEYGFTMTEAEAEEWRKQHPAPPPLPRTVCTKYELVNVLSAHFPELLTQLKAAYASTPELQFYWNTVNDLDRNNMDFQHFTESLGVTAEQLDAIFAALDGQIPESSVSE